jgi:tRNA (adenine37-N6)-methyltransferase
MSLEYAFTSIAHVCKSKNIKYLQQKQGSLQSENTSIIEFLPHQNYETALEDLEGFERIWLLFVFHQNLANKGRCRKVLPPGSSNKRGVFATRSPHRPNPIGLSSVRLLRCEGLRLWVAECDLLDQTPILDIKPYLPYCDSFSNPKTGWVNLPQKFKVLFSERVSALFRVLESFKDIDLTKDILTQRLNYDPYPQPSNRIKNITENSYSMSHRTWKVFFTINNSKKIIYITELNSAYSDLNTIENPLWLKWHQALEKAKEDLLSE